MANRETGSRPTAVDHDLIAGFLAGEVERRHADALNAAGLLCPGVDEELDLPELEAQRSSGDTDGNPTCSNCCTAAQCQDVTTQPRCDTKAQCHTYSPHCKTHEHDCRHKPHHEPPKHASWFDRR